MSGVTLAVSPSPADTDQTTTTTSKAHNKRQPQQQRGIMGSLRVIELQLVAFIMVFSVSGLVPLLDLVFPAFVTAYILALARFAFPAHGTTSAGSSEEIIFEGNNLFRLYVVVGTTVGLFLPLAYVLGGFARGDEQAVQLATPHLFLLSFQILTENIISGMGLFSPPVRALVTLLYTVRRTFVLIDWLLDIWFYKSLPANAHLQDIAWHWFGKSLSMANLVYFSVNMLGFLIPVFLPRAFERYFKGRNEIHAKIAEDKYSTAAHKTQPVGAAVADKKTD